MSLRPKGNGVLAAALLLLATAVVSCAGGGDGTAASVGKGGSPAPAARAEAAGKEDSYAKLAIQDTQGRTIRLADFSGKVRLIDVWATWCGACRMIIPHLNILADRYRSEGLVVIGVSVDSSPADVAAFTAQVPIKYPTGMMNPELGDLLGNPEAIPTSFLVDRNGRLRRKFVGFVDPDTMEREVRRYLAPR